MVSYGFRCSSWIQGRIPYGDPGCVVVRLGVEFAYTDPERAVLGILGRIRAQSHCWRLILLCANRWYECQCGYSQRCDEQYEHELPGKHYSSLFCYRMTRFMVIRTS